ncbi:protein phosphatase 2C domain-containing protein [Pseudalkalibacillus sp. SCS-8]|uniref:protein phosphatase 2C domain-containing protein n=1 Tax=Pseudalkalibacillus nanhaiensis TaxID=3115291 RepID=UPI0032DB9D3E
MIEKYVHQRVDLSTFQRSKIEGQCNGDSYFTKETKDYFVCLVADGLGSGQAAHDASAKAVKVVEDNHHEDVDTLIQLCNDALFNTRGAVLTLFKVYFKDQILEYCGVGNIRLIIGLPSGKIVHAIPKSGFLSGKPMKFDVRQVSIQEGSMFIAYSDGVELSSPDKRNVMRAKSPRVASSYLKQKCLQAVDDMTCVIGKVT